MDSQHKTSDHSMKEKSENEFIVEILSDTTEEYKIHPPNDNREDEKVSGNEELQEEEEEEIDADEIRSEDLCLTESEKRENEEMFKRLERELSRLKTLTAEMNNRFLSKSKSETASSPAHDTKLRSNSETSREFIVSLSSTDSRRNSQVANETSNNKVEDQLINLSKFLKEMSHADRVLMWKYSEDVSDVEDYLNFDERLEKYNSEKNKSCIQTRSKYSNNNVCSKIEKEVSSPVSYNRKTNKNLHIPGSSKTKGNGSFWENEESKVNEMKTRSLKDRVKISKSKRDIVANNEKIKNGDENGLNTSGYWLIPKRSKIDNKKEDFLFNNILKNETREVLNNNSSKVNEEVNDSPRDTFKIPNIPRKYSSGKSEIKQKEEFYKYLGLETKSSKERDTNSQDAKMRRSLRNQKLQKEKLSSQENHKMNGINMSENAKLMDKVGQEQLLMKTENSRLERITTVNRTSQGEPRIKIICRGNETFSEEEEVEETDQDSETDIEMYKDDSQDSNMSLFSGTDFINLNTKVSHESDALTEKKSLPEMKMSFPTKSLIEEKFCYKKSSESSNENALEESNNDLNLEILIPEKMKREEYNFLEKDSNRKLRDNTLAAEIHHNKKAAEIYKRLQNAVKIRNTEQISIIGHRVYPKNTEILRALPIEKEATTLETIDQESGDETKKDFEEDWLSIDDGTVLSLNKTNEESRSLEISSKINQSSPSCSKAGPHEFPLSPPPSCSDTENCEKTNEPQEISEKSNKSKHKIAPVKKVQQSPKHQRKKLQRKNRRLFAKAGTIKILRSMTSNGKCLRNKKLVTILPTKKAHTEMSSLKTRKQSDRHNSNSDKSSSNILSPARRITEDTDEEPLNKEEKNTVKMKVAKICIEKLKFFPKAADNFSSKTEEIINTENNESYRNEINDAVFEPEEEEPEEVSKETGNHIEIREVVEVEENDEILNIRSPEEELIVDEEENKVVGKCSVPIEKSEYIQPPNNLPNPLSLSKGNVLHIFYINDQLIVIQDFYITCWKYSKYIQMLGQPQDWELMSEYKRMLNDLEVSAPYRNRICLNESNPIYVEMRAKQLPKDASTRECNLASVYINIYYFHEWKASVVMHSVQLDTIRGHAIDIHYTTIPNSRYFIMCWKQETVLGGSRTGLCKYALTPDLDTLASIREFKQMRHHIDRLECINDDKLIGFGETQVTLWDHKTGDVITNFDLEMSLGYNIGSVLSSMEFKNYLFLYQVRQNENIDVPELKILVITLSYNNPTFRIVYTHELPSQFTTIKSSLSCEDFVIGTATNGEEFLLIPYQPHRVYYHNPSNLPEDTKHFYTNGSKNFIEISGDSLIVKTIHEYLMNFMMR